MSAWEAVVAALKAIPVVGGLLTRYLDWRNEKAKEKRRERTEDVAGGLGHVDVSACGGACIAADHGVRGHGYDVPHGAVRQGD